MFDDEDELSGGGQGDGDQGDEHGGQGSQADAGDSPEDDPLGEDEDLADDEDEGGEAPEGDGSRSSGQGVRDQGRGNRHFGELRRENRELRERLERIERSQSQPQPQLPRETPQQRAERLSLMGPAELAAEIDNSVNQRLMGVQLQVADTADRSAFQAILSRKPELQRYEAKVEAEVNRIRAQGQIAPARGIILEVLVGRAAINGVGRAKPRQEREAQRDKNRQQARPGSGRGDVPRDGREKDPAAARRKRLEDMTF